MRALDRVVQEVTTGFERGIVSIGAAAAGMRTLADATGSFQTKFRYLLVAVDGISWQIGVGEYFPGSPDFVDLSAVSWSSNSGSRISLPTPQGGPHGWLYCIPAAADMAGRRRERLSRARSAGQHHRQDLQGSCHLARPVAVLRRAGQSPTTR